MKSGPDMFFARVGKDAILKTTLLPALSVGVRNGAGWLGATQVQNMPLAVFAPALGCVIGAVRAVIPI